jgi:hypothetical protein
LTSRLRGALSKVELADATLALHLRNSIKAGDRFSYRPEPPISWN